MDFRTIILFFFSFVNITCFIINFIVCYDSWWDYLSFINLIYGCGVIYDYYARKRRLRELLLLMNQMNQQPKIQKTDWFKNGF